MGQKTPKLIVSMYIAGPFNVFFYEESNGGGLPHPPPMIKSCHLQAYFLYTYKDCCDVYYNSTKKKEAMSTPIKYPKFWFKLSFALMVYNNENMCNNWTILAKWKW